MATNPQPDYDVIVIGGGLSGLTSAYYLLQNKPDCKVLVLEAKDRVGGRTLTVQLQGSHGPDSWDLGGQWICRSQHHILWLMGQLGIDSTPQWTQGKKLMKLGDNKRRTFSSSIPTLPFLSLLDLHFFMRKVEKLVQTVPRDDPRLAPSAEDLDNITVENLVCQNTWTTATKEVIETAAAIISGARLREMSALYFLHYISMAGSLREVIESEDGAGQEWKVRGGAQNISIALVDIIGKENVLLEEPVTLIDQSRKDFITVVTGTDKTFTCQNIICAAPVHCAAAISYKPKPPLTRIALSERMPVGHIFKFVVTYKTAFWREAGYSGEVVSTGGASSVEGCDTGPIQLVYDALTGAHSPALVGFYSNSRQWRDIEPETRKAALLESLVEFFGPEAGQPVDFAEKDWALEPYNGGCPVNFMSPGAITLYFDGLRTPFDRVHWAGTETATQWSGFLNGAVQAGMRAAEEVLREITPNRQKEMTTILEKLDQKRPAKAPESGTKWILMIGALVVGLVVTGVVAKRYNR
ncbi:probable flavin-containing monoamine oxidase A [Apostichopus japonicus]|uniref:probable flavin-containing monoamine oxidase A n=1 Tax=Stichopus japonicus TaxID=307972 RepID=UPI003AB430B2